MDKSNIILEICEHFADELIEKGLEHSLFKLDCNEYAMDKAGVQELKLLVNSNTGFEEKKEAVVRHLAVRFEKILSSADDRMKLIIKSLNGTK